MSDSDSDSDEIHPLLGVIVDDDIPQLVNLPPPPAPDDRPLDIPTSGPIYISKKPPAPKMYCESCGHVGQHADGCPRDEALRGLEELDREEAELARVESAAPEPIVPLVRRIGASLLRRFAKIVEPKESS